MRLNEPRINPVDPENLTDDQAAFMARFDGHKPPLNIFATLANYPGLAKRWMVFANHVLTKSTLSPRDRELAILRIGWLCRSGYEWAQHARIGQEVGLTDVEIARVQDGPEVAGWSPVEALVLRATDELHADAFISDPTWAGLREHFSTEQMMDLVFAVGQYTLVSMALNTFGVQLEPDLVAEDLG